MRGNWISADGEGGGLELHSNFHQLFLLRAKDDPSILDIMQRKTQKYTDHHIQNELLQILSLGHLCKITADINEAGFFTLKVMRSQIPATKSKKLCASGGLMHSLSLITSSLDSIMFLTLQPALSSEH